MMMMKWNDAHRKNFAFAVGLALLLLLFGIAVANSNDACMANAQLGLNLTWWTGINNFAAFVLVILMYKNTNPMMIVMYIGFLFVPWHVIGFILFATSQSSCLSPLRAVGAAAALIFVVDVLLVVTGVLMYFRPAPHPHRADLAGATGGPQKQWWMKKTFYLGLFIGAASLVALSIGAGYMEDDCLSDDPTGIDLAQWILTLGTVTFAFFCVLAVAGITAHGHALCKENVYANGFDWIVKACNAISVLVAIVWAVFLIVWIPLGLFLAASTQAECITGSTSGQMALTAGLVFSLLLPIAAVATVDKYTTKLWNFPSGGSGFSQLSV